MFTRYIYDDDGFSLLEFLLGFMVLSMVMVVVVRLLVWGHGVWLEQHGRVVVVQKKALLSRLLPYWWQEQRLNCLALCGCKFVPRLFAVGQYKDFGVGKGVSLPRCVDGQLVWVSLFISRYQGVHGRGLGLYTRLGAEDRRLLVLGVSDLNVEILLGRVAMPEVFGLDMQLVDLEQWLVVVR